MESVLSAIELTGTVDENHQLRLDAALPLDGPKRVRVIVLYTQDDAFDEAQWLRAAAQNPVFDILKNEADDIYSLADGRPFNAEV